MKYLDLENWSRKEHFHFFNNYDEPFWGVVVDINCQKVFTFCKENKQSFFLCYLYCAVRAANDIEQFKYRIVDKEKIQIVERIDASAVINRDDGSFGFSHIVYNEVWDQWFQNATMEIDRVRLSTKLFPEIHNDSCIHFSSLPWLKFRSLSHARKFHIGDSVPKISFGKVFNENNLLKLPVAIHVHHSLVDGKDVGKYVERLEYLMENVSDLIQ
jgi:chloramphenicol O-acetyltransferase type A